MIFPTNAAPKPPVEAKACHVGLEDPQVQPGVGSSCQELIGDVTKKPLADSLTASLWTDVKIIDQASPDGIDITIAADERLHEPGVVEGNVDKLRCRRVAEPLRPDGEPVRFDGAVQELGRENVRIRVTPACGMDGGDERCVLFGCRSDDDVAQLMWPRVRKSQFVGWVERSETHRLSPGFCFDGFRFALPILQEPLLRERVAFANGAGRCRCGRHPRGREEFAAQTSVLERLAALAAEVNAGRAALKARIEADDHLRGGAADERARADQVVAFETKMTRGLLRGSLMGRGSWAMPALSLEENPALSADVDRLRHVPRLAGRAAIADRIHGHDIRDRNALVAERGRRVRGFRRAGGACQHGTCAHDCDDPHTWSPILFAAADACYSK